MDSKQLLDEIQGGKFEDSLLRIYPDQSLLNYEKGRYITAISKYQELFGAGEIAVFSAPGRSEIGGNHTDHQHGKVLAAAIHLDVIAVIGKTSDHSITIISDNKQLERIEIGDLKKKEYERGKSEGLVRGVIAYLKNAGYHTGGFKAYMTSDVIIGAGLSSSAAFENIIGTIISHLYNNGKIDPIENAKAGQYAENVYFGKPCGLMDQIASCVGGIVAVNFINNRKPIVNSLKVDFEEFGYSLCIVDTKGSHADLTDDYAAIPTEMKQVAQCFHKSYLSDVHEEDFYENFHRIRNHVNDRSLLRALHLFEENKRVDEEVNSLLSGDFKKFLLTVNQSGNSSFKYLQNVYSNNSETQEVSVALALSERVLNKHGVCRVHGGGFAGTIQIFVENEFVGTYIKAMEHFLDKGCCHVLKIRKCGGIRVM